MAKRIVYSDENIALASQWEDLVKKQAKQYKHFDVSKIDTVILNVNGKKTRFKPANAVRQAERAIEFIRTNSSTSFLKPYIAKPIIWTFTETAFSDGIRIAMSPLFAATLIKIGSINMQKNIDQIVTSSSNDDETAEKQQFETTKYLQFVIIHECYHALYLHIRRSLLKIGKGNEMQNYIANMAMDLEINRDIEAQLPQYKGCTLATDGVWYLKEEFKNKDTNSFFVHETWETIYDYFISQQDQIPEQPPKTSAENPKPKQNNNIQPDNSRKNGWNKAIEAIKNRKIDPMKI